MKNNKTIAMAILAAGILVSCANNSSSSAQPTTSSQTTQPTTSLSLSTTRAPDINKPTTIYLAGDSTVKTYGETQYIGGWGQYLDLFLDEYVKVVNTSNGGRSSRSFINEGRLYNIDDPTFSYNFSQNEGNSIEDVINEGDFLFIQFGHNDDASKLSNYSTIYDRMVPLGEKDSNGIYPTTPATKVATTILPDEYTNAANDSEEAKALTEIAKYGSEYYAYNSGGTYKWYLKQYIDFARSKNAIPVLVTPVARVKFSNGEIIGGAGLHGENFAYVEAVRQLAEEESCLLIDLFADSKEILETATQEYANYLMALKPNDLIGDWPKGYDEAYGNSELGYTGIEATHYNKYGAFLQAAKVVETILDNEAYDGEYFSFKGFINEEPSSYIDPSNLMSKKAVADVEALFEDVNVTNPNRVYPDPNEVVTAINELGNVTEITTENYLEYQEKAIAVREQYNSLNVDDRGGVTNLATLEEIENKIEEIIEALRPKPIETVIHKFDDLSAGLLTENVVNDGYTIYAVDGGVEVVLKSANGTYNGEVYEANSYIKLGGTAKYGTGKYIGFEVEKACRVTLLCKSSGSSERTINIVDSTYKTVGSYPAEVSAAMHSVDLQEGGQYYIGSAGSGVYVYLIIIEYYE